MPIPRKTTPGGRASFIDPAGTKRRPKRDQQVHPTKADKQVYQPVPNLHGQVTVYPQKTDTRQSPPAPGKSAAEKNRPQGKVAAKSKRKRHRSHRKQLAARHSRRNAKRQHDERKRDRSKRKSSGFCITQEGSHRYSSSTRSVPSSLLRYTAISFEKPVAVRNAVGQEQNENSQQEVDRQDTQSDLSMHTKISSFPPLPLFPVLLPPTPRTPVKGS